MTVARENPSAFERWRAATLAPFSHRAFALFWWASLISSFGSLIQTVGASWLMTTIAPSTDMIALVQTAGALPFFFLSLLAGAFADTRDRRATMIFSQLLMLVASAVLAAITLAGAINPTLLLGLTFLIGCGTAIFAPAWQSSISELVPRTQIASAVMANAVGFNLARSIGPAIGGVLVAAAGAAVSFVVNALSYIGMLAVVIWWRPQRVRGGLPPEPLGSAISAGIRYVRLSPHLLAILARCLLFAIPMAATPALMPVVARDLLGGDARTYGLLLGGFGIGAMVGALSSAPLRSRFSSDRLLQILSALAATALLVNGQSTVAALTLAAHVLAGSTWTLGLANFNIAIQLSSPRWVMGRMLATYQTIAFAGMAFGSWGWGVLAERIGLRESLTIAGGVAFVSFPIQRSSPRWVMGRMLATYQTIAFAGMAFGSWGWGVLAERIGLRESLTIAGGVAFVSLLAARWLPVSVASLGSLDPHGGPEVAPPKVDIHPASGPIVVTITYRVPAENAAEFVEVINEYGRIRSRDGARRWSVCQDIDDPQYWVERFESPTWLDYLRRQTRMTLADVEVRDRIRKLILGERGTVRRTIERPSGSEPLGGEHQRPEVLDGSSTPA